MFKEALIKMLLATRACFSLSSTRAIEVINDKYIKSRNGGTKTGAAALKRTASKLKAIKAKSSKRK